MTIFLSTHFMNEAERCDRMSMMHAGKVLAQGPPAELVEERKAKNLEAAFIGYLEDAAAKSGTKSAAAATETAAAAAAAAEGHAAASRRRRAGRFSLGRVWAFARREAIELRHDTVRLTFAVLGPILLMIVFGYGISLDVDHLTFSVLDFDGTQASRTYADSLSRLDLLRREPSPISDYAELDRRLRNGELRFALEIPPGFEKDLDARRASRRSPPISTPPCRSAPKPRAAMSRTPTASTKQRCAAARAFRRGTSR